MDMNRRTFSLVAAAAARLQAAASPGSAECKCPGEMSLNGPWRQARPAGTAGRFPSLGWQPTEGVQSGPLWYRREVDLPAGELDPCHAAAARARFAPRVYVNGQLVSSAPAAWPAPRIRCGAAVRPGGRIQLEVELQSLKDLDPRDASRIPKADEYRSNLSSCLWIRRRYTCTGRRASGASSPSGTAATTACCSGGSCNNSPVAICSLRFELVDRNGEVVARSAVLDAFLPGAQMDLREPRARGRPTSRCFTACGSLSAAGRAIDITNAVWPARIPDARHRFFAEWRAPFACARDHSLAPVRARSGSRRWLRSGLVSSGISLR